MPATRPSQRGARAPAAATFESDDDEQLFEQDSEEDEWATDRQAGPSRAFAYQQDSDDDDDDEPGHAMHDDDDEEDGVAAFESDPGEELEDTDDDADPEVRRHVCDYVLVCSTDLASIRTGRDREA